MWFNIHAVFEKVGFLRKKFKITEEQNIRISIIISFISMFSIVVITLFYDRFLLSAFNDDGRTYGIFSFSSSLASWLSLLTLGFSSTYVRFASKTMKERGPEGLKKLNAIYFVIYGILTSAILLLGTVGFVLLKVNAISLDGYSQSEKELISILFILNVLYSGTTFFISLFGYFLSFSSRFVWLRTTTLLFNIFSPLIAMLFIYLGAGIWVVLVIQICLNLLIGIANFIYSIRFLKFRFNFRLSKATDWPVFKEILIFTLFVGLNIAIDQINSNLGKTLLGFFGWPEMVTVLSFGYAFSTYESSMANSVSNSYITKINKAVAENDSKEISRIFLHVSEIQAFILIFVCGGFASCGLQFCQAWLGNELNSDSLTSVYLIGLTYLVLFAVPYSQTSAVEIQRAFNKHRMRFYILAAASLINIVSTASLLVVLPYDLKLLGVMIGCTISVVGGQWIALNLYYKKALKLAIGKYFLNFLILLALSSASAALTWTLFSAVHIEISNLWIITILRGLVFVVIFGFLGTSYLLRKRILLFFKTTGETLHRSLLRVGKRQVSAWLVCYVLSAVSLVAFAFSATQVVTPTSEIVAAIAYSYKVDDDAPYVFGSVESSNFSDTFKTFAYSFDDRGGNQIHNNSFKFMYVDGGSDTNSPITFYSKSSGNIYADWMGFTAWNLSTSYCDFKTISGAAIENPKQGQVYVTYDLGLKIVGGDEEKLADLSGSKISAIYDYRLNGENLMAKDIEILDVLARPTDSSSILANNFIGEDVVVSSYNYERSFSGMRYFFSIYRDQPTIQLNMKWVIDGIKSLSNEKVSYSLSMYNYSDDYGFYLGELSPLINKVLVRTPYECAKYFSVVSALLYLLFSVLSNLFVFEKRRTFDFASFCLSALLIVILTASLSWRWSTSIFNFPSLFISHLGITLSFCLVVLVLLISKLLALGINNLRSKDSSLDKYFRIKRAKVITKKRKV